MSHATVTRGAPSRLSDLAPALGAALSFSAADVLGKVVFASGMDVLSLVTLRGILAVVFFWWWIRASPPRARHSPRARLIALALGLLFAANIFGLLLAIQVLPLSIAILTYFIYPLLTGIAAVALRLERLGWRSFACALAALLGLALMLGTQPGNLAPIGLLAAFGAAICRVVSLLVTLAALRGTDARLTTWYSLAPSAAVFIVVSLAVGTFHAPQNVGGWAAFVGMSVSTTLSTLWIYVSTARVGAFRTALLMNLEPVLSSCMSFVLLNEPVSALQLVGGAIMVAALCVFQFR
ncbi:MAG: DMT family transporter [Acetobacteraceae bacterium]|nr:DMT family transporter [Acetobacteraceae bacterium]